MWLEMFITFTLFEPLKYMFKFYQGIVVSISTDMALIVSQLKQLTAIM